MKRLLIQLVAVTHLRIGGHTLTPPPSTERGRADRYIQSFDLNAAKAVVAAKQMQPAYDHDAQALTKAGVPCVSFYGPFKTEAPKAPPEQPEQKPEQPEPEQKPEQPETKTSKRKRKTSRSDT